jgi:phosphoglycerate dehydrogenase-like enzyme
MMIRLQSSVNSATVSGATMALPSRLRARLEPRLEGLGKGLWYDDIEGAMQASRQSDLVWLTVGRLKREEVRQLLDDSPRLRWVHVNMAGVDRLDLEPFAERGILLTNGAGLAAEPIAEHVIMFMLAGRRRLHDLLRAQSQGIWTKAAAGGDELSGSSALVIGFGHLGRAIASRARALGVDVTGVRRRPSSEAGEVGEDGWRQLLPTSDFVILSLPLTPRTRHLVGAAELAAMKPGAWLINVARGAIVDEDALLEALRQDHLGGAALDVFEQEPLPPEHPFWAEPKLILTPHVSWVSSRADERAVELFSVRLQQFLTNAAAMPVIDLAEGY